MNNAKKWQQLNFVVGEAKLSIYKRRKNKLENVSCHELVPAISESQSIGGI